MGTIIVSDAVVVPQSSGTGLGSDGDVVDAASAALMSGYTRGEYVQNGLTFSNVVTTDGSESVDIEPGTCFILDTSSSTAGNRGSGGNPSIHSTSSSGYDTEVPTNPAYLVIIPSTVGGLSLDTDAINEVYVSLDVTSQNSVTVHGTSGSAPTDPYIPLGKVNASNGNTVRVRDGAHIQSRRVFNTFFVGDNGYETVQDAHDEASATDRIFIAPSYDETNESFPIRITKEVTVQQAGRGVINNSGTSDTFDVDHGGSNNFPGAKFINVNIDGGKYGFRQKDARYVTYTNCWVDNATKGWEISVAGSTNQIGDRFYNCTAMNCSGIGFHFGSLDPNATTMVGCLSEFNGGDGVHVENGAQMGFYGCIFQLNDGYGLDLGAVRGATVSNCYFEDNDSGNNQDVLVRDVQGGSITDCYFTGANNNNHAVVAEDLGSSSNWSIKNCHFVSYAAEFIRLNTGSDIDIHRTSHTFDSSNQFQDGATRSRTDGVIVSQDLSTVTGQFNGDRAFDDGTNTSSGRTELAVWDVSSGAWLTMGGDII